MTNDDLDNEVLGEIMLHVGKENKISRSDLISAVTGILRPNIHGTIDRSIRESLERLSERYPILSTSEEGGGYWYASSQEEIRRVMSSYRSRAWKNFLRYRRLKKMHDQDYGPARRLPGMER